MLLKQSIESAETLLLALLMLGLNIWSWGEALRRSSNHNNYCICRYWSQNGYSNLKSCNLSVLLVRIQKGKALPWPSLLYTDSSWQLYFVKILVLCVESAKLLWNLDYDFNNPACANSPFYYLWTYLSKSRKSFKYFWGKKLLSLLPHSCNIFFDNQFYLLGLCKM